MTREPCKYGAKPAIATAFTTEDTEDAEDCVLDAQYKV